MGCNILLFVHFLKIFYQKTTSVDAEKQPMSQRKHVKK